MANILKCKMCGGDIEVSQDMTVGKCLFCGSTMTLPRIDSEKKARLFNRANEYRLNNEFDKAYNAYKAIVEEDVTEAEGYWGMVLSEYGVEYVEDPKTGKRVPTCHRTRLQPIMSSVDYKQAIQYADAERKFAYQDEAEQLNKIQKEIMAISSKEEPYSVFICYKESDDNTGERTKDSVLAQDIYDALEAKGIRTFFARISLEDKLGQNYEPFIFSALSSAKVMIHVTTSPENSEAVWVKNEWSRYVDFMSENKSKTLIPVYLEMSPYELPDQMQKLQAQDMSKVGAIQDLVRGIQKLLGEGQARLDANNEILQAMVKERQEKEEAQKRIAEAEKAKQEKRELLHQQRADKAKSFWKKHCIKIIIATILVVFIVVMVIILTPIIKYNNACKNLESGNYEVAYSSFAKMVDYKDSKEKMIIAGYKQVISLVEKNEIQSAKELHFSLGNQKDTGNTVNSSEEIKDIYKEASYQLALGMINNGQIGEPQELFEKLGDYKDSKDRVLYCNYLLTVEKLKAGDLAYVGKMWRTRGLLRDEDKTVLREDVTDYLQDEYNKVEKNPSQDSYESYLDSYNNLADICIESPDLYYCVGKAELECEYWEDAITYLQKAEGIKDSSEKLNEAKYNYCLENKENIYYDSVAEYLNELSEANYKDSAMMKEAFFARKSIVGTWRGNGSEISFKLGKCYYAKDSSMDYSYKENEGYFVIDYKGRKKYKGVLMGDRLYVSVLEKGNSNYENLELIKTGVYMKAK